MKFFKSQEGLRLNTKYLYDFKKNFEASPTRNLSNIYLLHLPSQRAGNKTFITELSVAFCKKYITHPFDQTFSHSISTEEVYFLIQI